MQMISCKKTSNGAHLENNIIINKIIYSRIHLKKFEYVSVFHTRVEEKVVLKQKTCVNVINEKII